MMSGGGVGFEAKRQWQCLICPCHSPLPLQWITSHFTLKHLIPLTFKLSLKKTENKDTSPQPQMKSYPTQPLISFAILLM